MDRWIWYPYLEKPFPWVGVGIYGLPIVLVLGICVAL